MAGLSGEKNEKPKSIYELNASEKANRPSWYKAMGAGLVSGAIKIPEGFVSLFSDVYDLTKDTNTAAKVEDFFDTINPFEEIAEERLSGKITEIIINYGIPANWGRKFAQKIARKAVDAKRAGQYTNIKSQNLKDALIAKNRKTDMGLETAAGFLGIGAGEAIVASERSLSEIGSIFSGKYYPLTYEAYNSEKVYGEQPSNSEDAWRRLKNRAKWGIEGGLLTSAIVGTGKVGKFIYKNSKDMVNSNSRIVRILDKAAASVRPRGEASLPLFNKLNKLKGDKKAQENMANEIMMDFNKALDSIYPALSTSLNAATKKERKEVYNLINDILKSYKEGIPDREMTLRLINMLKSRGATDPQLKTLLGEMYKMRSFLDKPLRSIGSSLEQAGIKDELFAEVHKSIGRYLENTYKLMNRKGVGLFGRVKPGQEAVDRLKKLLMRHARMRGYPLTDLEATEMVQLIIRSGSEATTTMGSKRAFWSLNLDDLGHSPERDILEPIFNKLYNTMKGGARHTDQRRELTPLFKELFGEVKDPRMNFLDAAMNLVQTTHIFNTFNDIVNSSRQNFKRGATTKIVKGPDGVEQQMVTGFDATKSTYRPIVVPDDVLGGFRSEADKIKFLETHVYPNQKVVRLEFHQGTQMGESFLANPLKGAYAPREHAKMFEVAQKSPWRETTGFRIADWLYKNLGLLPKGYTNLAKTVFGQFTHARNFISAGYFTAATGVATEALLHPKLVWQAWRESYKALQGPFKSGNTKEANRVYREMLELGIVNSNARLGDVTRLMDDVHGAGGPLGYATSKEPIKVWKKYIKKFQDAYVAEDDFWKMFINTFEKMRLKRAFPEWSEEQIKREAAKRVRDTVPNYEYVGSLQKAFRLSPFGNFLSFPSEIIRGTYNNAELAIQDMSRGYKRGLKTGNWWQHWDGWNRLIGVTAGIGAGGSMLEKYGQYRTNASQEKLDAVRMFVAEYAKNNPLMLMEDDADGNPRYIDLGYIMPYEGTVSGVRGVLLEVANGDTNEQRLMAKLRDGVLRGLGHILEPFISPSIWFTSMTNLFLRDGETKTGRQIWNPEDEWWTKVEKATGHLLYQSAPLNYSQLKRLWQAYYGIETKGWRTHDFTDELGGIAGFRVQVIKPEERFPQFINTYQDTTENAYRYMTESSYARDPVNFNPQGLLNSYRDYLRVAFEAQRTLYYQMQAAKELGMSRKEMREKFGGRVSYETWRNIEKGKFDPNFISRKMREFFSSEARMKGLPNPYSGAKSSLRQLYLSNKNKSLTEDLFDPRSDIQLEVKKGFFSKQSQLPAGVGAPVITAQNYTAPGLILPQQGQNQYNPATGLSRTESALLSPSDQVIRKQQRGII